MKKICAKCGKEHDKKGLYCSRSCANSRIFSKEAIEKKSIASKKQWADNREKMITATLLASEEIVEQNLKNKELREEIAYKKYMAKGWDNLGYDTKRRCILFEQNYKCNKCGIKDWLEKPLSLELEHKDGNRDNNARGNLECLCPNCHSQTPTWRGRHRQQKLNLTDAEIYAIYIKSGTIPKTVKALGLRMSSSSKNRVKKSIKRHIEILASAQRGNAADC